MRVGVFFGPQTVLWQLTSNEPYELKENGYEKSNEANVCDASVHGSAAWIGHSAAANGTCCGCFPNGIPEAL